MSIKYRVTRPPRPIDLPWETRPTALVWVEAPDYDEDGALHTEGDERVQELVRQAISMAYGDRGRSLNAEEPFSPRDLACALFGRWMKHFEPVELSGEAGELDRGQLE